MVENYILKLITNSSSSSNEIMTEYSFDIWSWLASIFTILFPRRLFSFSVD